MNKRLEKIKKILGDNNFWDHSGNQYRYSWKKFWQRKLQLYNKYSYWRFVLATPLYLTIFVWQLFVRKHWGDVKTPEWLQYEYLRKKYPEAVDYYQNRYTFDWNKISREDWPKGYATARTEMEAHDEWIKSLSIEEQKELVALWEENEKKSGVASRAAEEDSKNIKNFLIENSPAGFYPDGAFPGKYKK